MREHDSKTSPPHSNKKRVLVGAGITLVLLVFVIGYFYPGVCSLEDYKKSTFPNIDDPEYKSYIDKHLGGCIDPSVINKENFPYTCQLVGGEIKPCPPIRANLDGNPEEWSNRAPIIVDSIGDSPYKTIDLVGVYHATDSEGNHYFFLDFGNTTLNPYCDYCGIERKGDFYQGILPKNGYDIVLSLVPKGYIDGTNYSRKFAFRFQWKSDNTTRFLYARIDEKGPEQPDTEAKTLYAGNTYLYHDPNTKVVEPKITLEESPIKYAAGDNTLEVEIDKDYMPEDGLYTLHVLVGIRDLESPNFVIADYATSRILLDLST